MRVFNDRVVVITGAAGGIGRALAKQLADKGCVLALVDIDPQAAADVVAQLGEGVKAKAYTADVRDPAALDTLAQAIATHFGEVSVLVPAAGATVWGTFDTHTADDIDFLLDLNVRGVAQTCRAFLPLLKATSARHGEAHVALVSSMQGLFGVPMQSLYVTTKYAVRGLAASLRVELSASNIGVSVTFPGAVRGSFMANGRSHDDASVSEMLPHIKRFGVKPERVAASIVRSIRSNKAEAFVGIDSRAVAWMRWVVPPFLPALVGWSFRTFTPDGRLVDE